MSEEIGRRIRAAREKLRWSQGKLANAVGVNALTVMRWEHGRAVPHHENQQRLIEHLGMRQEDFLVEEEQSASSQPFQPFEPGQEQLTASPPVRPPPAPQLTLPPRSEFKLYRGRRIIQRLGHGSITRFPYVTVNGRPLAYFNTRGPGTATPDPEKERVFEWGYAGGGPSNLAVAILADYFGETSPARWASKEEYQAVRYCNRFRDDFVSLLPRGVDDEWEISSDQIANWLLSLEEKKAQENDE